jgi:hypothetical protein
MIRLAALGTAITSALTVAVLTDGAASALHGAATAGPAYVSIVAGRMEWSGTQACQPLSGSVDLGMIAARTHQLSSRLTVYGTIVGDRTANGTTRTCVNGVLYPTWTDLAALHSQYGWDFGSNGQHHVAMTAPGQTPAQLWSTSCGALRDAVNGLVPHGYQHGWSLFAYPFGGDEPQDLNARLQAAYVSRCFAFGRLYDNVPPYATNTRASVASSNWLVQTHEIFGGTCNDPNPSAPCHSIPSSGGHVYDNPADLTALVQPSAGQWAVLQFHLIVEGSRLSGSGPQWDCTASDWRLHWATDNEMYCWGDFQAVLLSIPTSVDVVQPVVVANAWGRTMPPPALTAVSPTTGTTTGGEQVSITGGHFRAVGSPADGWAGGNGFEVTFGGVPATVENRTSNQITVLVPPAASPGPVNVTIYDADRQATTLVNGFTYT